MTVAAIKSRYFRACARCENTGAATEIDHRFRRHCRNPREQVERGETVTITRHGQPVAVLAPVKPARQAKTGEEWLEEAKRISKGITLGGITIRQLIEEGRR